MCSDDYNQYPDFLPLNTGAAYYVNVYRDLGVLNEDHCLFRQYILYMYCKAYSTTNLMFRYFHINALIKVYGSCDRPGLEYCSTVCNTYTLLGHD